MYFYFIFTLNALIEFVTKGVLQTKVGICIRGHQGNFIQAITIFSYGVPEPRAAEAWALLKAMEWIAELNMMNVVFEVDCKVEADGVLHGCKGVLDFIVLSLNVKSAYLII